MMIQNRLDNDGNEENHHNDWKQITMDESDEQAYDEGIITWIMMMSTIIIMMVVMLMVCCSCLNNKCLLMSYPRGPSVQL